MSCTQKITKLDAAERKLVAAVRAFVKNEDPIVVYSLAGDAAEVLGALCQRRGLKPFRAIALEAVPGLSHSAYSEAINRHRNFFKHARGDDADTVLEDFSDENNDALLFAASYDLLQLTAALGRGCPVEAQTIHLWFWAVRRDTAGLNEQVSLPQSLSDLSHVLHETFPDIHLRSRCEQKALGREAVAWAQSVPALADPVSR